MARAIEEAEVGLPASVLHVITGSGGTIGGALAGHPGVDGVVLAGVPTGSGDASGHGATDPGHVELGGKGANIVFPDADLGWCAKAICFGIYMNAGQMCWAGSRLIVHQDVAEDLVDRIAAMGVGRSDGMSEGVRMGSLVHKDHRAEVLGALSAA